MLRDWFGCLNSGLCIDLKNTIWLMYFGPSSSIHIIFPILLRYLLSHNTNNFGYAYPIFVLFINKVLLVNHC